MTSTNKNTTTLAKAMMAIFAARDKPLAGAELMDTVTSDDELQYLIFTDVCHRQKVPLLRKLEAIPGQSRKPVRISRQ
jgi:hypothetical protein